jgi:hypothetical protein
LYPSHYNSFKVILICPLTSPLQLFQITFILFSYLTIATPWKHFHFALLFHLHNFIVISSKMFFLCHHFSLHAIFLHEILDPIFDNFVLCVAIYILWPTPKGLSPKYWGKLFLYGVLKKTWKPWACSFAPCTKQKNNLYKLKDRTKKFSIHWILDYTRYLVS